MLNSWRRNVVYSSMLFVTVCKKRKMFMRQIFLWLWIRDQCIQKPLGDYEFSVHFRYFFQIFSANEGVKEEVLWFRSMIQIVGGLFEWWNGENSKCIRNEVKRTNRKFEILKKGIMKNKRKKVDKKEINVCGKFRMRKMFLFLFLR